MGMTLAALVAHAAPVDLAAPAASFFSTSVGDSRSVVLRDDQTFGLTSFGIRMDPLVSTFNLTAQVFNFNTATNSRGALLATATQNFADLGLSFYDVNIAANLMTGQYYELNLLSFGLGNFNVEFYNFNGPPGGAGTPYAAGPITVFDGCGDGNVGGCGNTVLAHFELNANAAGTSVPEPSTLALVGLAIFGIAAMRRRID